MARFRQAPRGLPGPVFMSWEPRISDSPLVLRAPSGNLLHHRIFKGDPIASTLTLKLPRAVLIGVVALCVASCHPKRADIIVADDPSDMISIHVVNRNRIDVMVYVSHDGIRNRLGLATASTTTDFSLPLRTLGAGHEYKLVGDPLGVRIVITTETLVGQPGDEVTWSLEDSFARSSVVVH